VKLFVYKELINTFEIWRSQHQWLWKTVIWDVMSCSFRGTSAFSFRVKGGGSNLVLVYQITWYHFSENNLHINMFVAVPDQNSN
jgi:hypothetical protein